MEQILPSQFEIQNPESKRKKRFLLFEIGLFETGFVLILLVSIFGLLNYFNILKLSPAFQLLSFLPHLPYKTSSTQTVSSKIQATKTVYSYDLQNAKEKLFEYLPKLLKPEFIPKDSAKTQLVPILIPEKHQVLFHWTQQNSTDSAAFTGHVIYAPNTNNVETVLLELDPRTKTSNTIPISGVIASDLTQAFLLHSKSSSAWLCDSIGRACQDYILLPEGGEVNFGIIKKIINKEKTTVFACFVSREVLNEQKGIKQCSREDF